MAVRPVPGGRLSQGMAVDASITARLLGFRLLTLDARVTLVPATPVNTEPDWTAAAPPGSLGDAVELLAHASETLDQIGIAAGAGPSNTAA